VGHHCLCNHHAAEPRVLMWFMQESERVSAPQHASWHSQLPSPPPAPSASSCKLFPCSRGGSSTRKGEPDLPQFLPQCVKTEQQIRWFSSKKKNGCASPPCRGVTALGSSRLQRKITLMFCLTFAPAISAHGWLKLCRQLYCALSYCSCWSLHRLLLAQKGLRALVLFSQAA